MNQFFQFIDNQFKKLCCCRKRRHSEIEQLQKDINLILPVQQEIIENDQPIIKKIKKQSKESQQIQKEQILRPMKRKFLSIANYTEKKVFILSSKNNQQFILAEINSDFQKSEPIVEFQSFLEVEENIQKFYDKRYTLFSKFDEGILLDEESWYSVTPEMVAKSIAYKFQNKVVLDACCGCGGNLIQLAQKAKKVIGLDIDLKKIQFAQHNSKIYQVNKNIEIIQQDFLEKSCLNLIKDMGVQIDAVLMSPPWGGVNYNQQNYSLFTDILPQGIIPWIRQVNRKIRDCKQARIWPYFYQETLNYLKFLKYLQNQIIMKIHRELQLKGKRCYIEIEQMYLDHKLIGIMVYFGDLCKKPRSVDLSFIYDQICVFNDKQFNIQLKSMIRQLEKSIGLLQLFNIIQNTLENQVHNIYQFLDMLQILVTQSGIVKSNFFDQFPICQLLNPDQNNDIEEEVDQYSMIMEEQVTEQMPFQTINQEVRSKKIL